MASEWEHDARKLVSDGYRGGRAAPTMLYHPETDVRVVVREFTFARAEVELTKTQLTVREWYGVKVRTVVRNRRETPTNIVNMTRVERGEKCDEVQELGTCAWTGQTDNTQHSRCAPR